MGPELGRASAGDLEAPRLDEALLAPAQHGSWIGLLVLAGGCSILRWPVIYFVRWLRKGASQFRGPAE